MNKNSIIFSITLTFIITFTIIVFSFLTLYISNEKREEHLIAKSNHDMTRIFMREYRINGDSKELKELLEFMNFSLIRDSSLQYEILKSKNTKHLQQRHRPRFRLFVEELELNGKNYVYIKTPIESLMLANENDFNGNKNIIIFIFILILVFFTFLYISIINKLKPLSTLKNEVQKLADEDYDISCSSDKKDEISQLANEFDKTAKKLKSLRDSRDIFIRNIMHELKTPITKGRFLTELPKSEENNLKMQKVFLRLESLISEFASIEELISTKKTLSKKAYYLDDVLDEACDLLMCDEDELIKEFENIKIDVDFKLFSIAVKNLVDNGIKYSNDRKVYIKVKDKKIVFENTGNPLKYKIDKYYEPFFKADDVKSNQSFGLGLYIVKHILDAHSMGLEYVYEDGKNIFSIVI
ncbi:ArsS family sensor histidine kinase [Sulfurimonas sp.]|uniref:ArsS family sensor histidine kinase n=1 Tax=Sulfurimonas sp. TaxID=2022749 RepID=UPI0035682169